MPRALLRARGLPRGNHGTPAGNHLQLRRVGGGGGVLISLLIGIAFYVLVSLGLYGTFIKAGQPGWAGFVPLYNFIVLLRVAGRPKTWGWFLLLLIVPYLGSLAFFVVYIIVANDVSKSFGHGAGFTVGLVLPYVSVVFYYILWLGSSQYRGPRPPPAARR